MSHYKHLTLVDREKLLFFVGQGIEIAGIAQLLGRSRSTIYRELKRNSDCKAGYLPITAQKQYKKRRELCKRHKRLEDPALYELVKDRFLKRHWSPEQIAGRLKLEGSLYHISCATIYRAIYAGMFDTAEQRRSQGNRGMKRRLRHKGKPRNSKNGESRWGRLTVDHTIDERPQEANDRARFGDWEADTVLGKRGKACLVTLVDRKSRYLRCLKVAGCKSDLVASAIFSLMQGFPCKTITTDNGKEFAQFADISEALGGVPIYFAHPHHPWERASNENTNGLLREYFPKRKDMTNISDETVQLAEADLNNRPRKIFGFKTPAEIFFA